ncbi:hypothetical protein QAD02_017636 [Eretmocerus hayati]|uniref:Uncharacterized protein n=1 Tax=Eretmocerus hayati TaxID=131215 RepID=A0ACC2PGY1_9HYME|nr:hypothetical protein QAD02_017636 [Eretmocerus hayati]
MSVLNQSGDEVVECPLCMEPLEVDDLNFYPCTCGYQICRFCWHRIRTDENGLCPACRKAYSENPADFKPLTKEEIARLKAEKRLKDQQRKQRVTENRKHLANVRVVQKNLVFVVGLPMRLADADVLKKHEYFGKFGKIHKVVINQSTSYAGSQGPSASAYVTYQRQEDALRAIEAVNNIVVDGRTIKTSLGTTKYCSHFMRNQSCPKPDCMYLHDLGDQEASFTKEEMHQGKHQDYERKLVQSLHITTVQRKPTPSPPVTGTGTRENVPNPQAKEAWPSLNSGQSKDPVKESSPTQATVPPINVTNNENGTQNNTVPSTQKQNNNNKGESGVSSRRGKSNSESKAQAARNKHKNSQNKEKHGTTRTSSRSESNSNLSASGQTQVNGQEEMANVASDSVTSLVTVESSEVLVQKTSAVRLKTDQSTQQQQQQSGKLTKLTQQVHDMKINGLLPNGEHNHSESDILDLQREGSTPASTVSSSEDSIVNHQIERLVDSIEDTNSAAILGSSPASTSSSQGMSQQPPPGLHSTNSDNVTQSQHINHRSLFQSDNNSFFSSNTFQKISTSSTNAPATSQSTSTGIDWTSSAIAPIPDSLPTVYSSEDWQAAFGFQTELTRSSLHLSPKSSSSPSPRISFGNDDFIIDADADFSGITFEAAITDSTTANNIASSLLANAPSASKFMADFQQNALHQRLAMQTNQNTDKNDFIKQNGHATLSELQKQQEQQGGAETLKADDDLGFDPFHETQKALAELMENEVQIQQQRLFQHQQQQQQREREEQTRLHHQQNSVGIGPHNFSQVNHLAHLQQQAQHLQNLQVLQQPHTLLSRLPATLLQQNGGNQSPVQGSVSVTALGQRSRLPPPGFPSSTPNHMNSFGLGIPRPAPTTNTLTGSKILPFVSHSSGVLFTGGQQTSQTSFLQNQNPLLNSQGVGKCASDTIYALKDWCDMSSQQQQSQQQFHHQALYQKGGWNNFGSISDLNPVDPAIVSSRLLPFQTTTNTWQFPHAHPSHNAQQDQNAAPTQHWAMQPPPGFGAPSPNLALNVQTNSVQAHTKFISAGSEIESKF